MKTLILLLICTIALCSTNLVSNTTEINPVEEPTTPPALPEENLPAPTKPSDESESSDDSDESSSDESDTSDSESDREESSGRHHGRFGRHSRPWRHHRRPHPRGHGRPDWHKRPHPRGPEGSEQTERPASDSSDSDNGVNAQSFNESSDADRHWRHHRGHGRRPHWHRRHDWNRRHLREDGAHESPFNGEELFEVPRGDFDGEHHWRRHHHGHRRPHWHRRHHRGAEETERLAEDSGDFANVTNTESEGPKDVEHQWRRPHHGHRRSDWHRRPHPRDDAPEAQSNGEELFEVPSHEGHEFRRRPHWHRRHHPRDHHRRQHESQESEGSIPEQIAQPEVVAF